MNYGNEIRAVQALSNEVCVKELSDVLMRLSMEFQEALRRLAGHDKDFPAEGYSMLTEAYGLRTRANILFLTPAMHVVDALDFSQAELLEAFELVSKRLRLVDDLRAVNQILISVITFACSLGAGRGDVVNFLFRDICTTSD
ncbi:hypothetical protein [Pseudomonas putida]|uniref:hypothetical protein n=1 Tax=Pseudomonas putida TaxID=303 RepID=UPI0039E18D16